MDNPGKRSISGFGILVAAWLVLLVVFGVIYWGFPQKSDLFEENRYARLEKQVQRVPETLRPLLKPSQDEFLAVVRDKTIPELKSMVRDRAGALEELVEFAQQKGPQLNEEALRRDKLSLRLSPVPSQAETQAAIATLKGYLPLPRPETNVLEARIDGESIPEDLPGRAALQEARAALADRLRQLRETPWLEKDRAKVEAERNALEAEATDLHASIKTSIAKMEKFGLQDATQAVEEQAALVAKIQKKLTEDRGKELAEKEPRPLADPTLDRTESLLTENYTRLVDLYAAYQRYELPKLTAEVSNAKSLPQDLANNELRFQTSLLALNRELKRSGRQDLTDAIMAHARRAPSGLQRHLWEFMGAYMGDDELTATGKVRQMAKTLDPRKL